jgi:hypothetical protein
VCGGHEVLILVPHCDVRGCTVSDPDLYLDVVSNLRPFSPMRSFLSFGISIRPQAGCTNPPLLPSLSRRRLLPFHDIPNNIIPLTKKRIPILQRLLLLLIQILPLGAHILRFRRSEC